MHDELNSAAWVGFGIGVIIGSLIATLMFLWQVPDPRRCFEDEAWVHPDVINTWNVAHDNGCVPLDDLIGLLD